MVNIGSLRKNAKAVKGLAIRCDRASPLGNPYPLGAKYNREQSIAAFEDNWDNLMQNPAALKYFEFIKAQSKVRDIALLCWCKPLACHCDVIKAKLEE